MLPAVFVPVAVALASTGTSHAPLRPAGTGDKVVRIARTFLHSPYVWGGESRSGVDCSGLVVAVYRRLGVKLPHQSDELWHGLYRVKAHTPIAAFNESFSTRFSDEAFDTVGGLLLSQFGRLPKRGEEIQIDRLKFRVLRADSRRIQSVRVERLPEPE